MKSDAQLLIEYSEQGSEAAFGEIVARHTDLVYSATLRQVGSRELARDVAQIVFADLARKAPALVRRLSNDATLVGWLYRAARYASMTMLRTERRRQSHEREVMQPLDSAPEPSSNWDRLRPVLDEAMAGLNKQDRTALLLRYFRNEDLRVVGSMLGISDDAAQKRVSRSLEKLRKRLARRGVTTTATALMTALSLNAVQVAPAGLTAILTGASLAAVTGTGTTVSFMNLVTLTKLKAGIAVAVVLAGLATSLVVQHFSLARLGEENTAFRDLSRQVDETREENQRLKILEVDRDELERLRREHAELIRLRGEVGRLRRELAEQSRRNANIAGNAPPEVQTNVAPAQIVIEAKFVAIPSDSSFGSRGVPGAGMTGVLDEPQFRTVLKALEDTPGVDVLAAPNVTTLSGRQAQIAVTDVGQVNGVSAGPVREKPTGLVMDVLPTLGADGLKISLEALVQFPEAGHETDGKSEVSNLPWLSVTLWDGQTLVYSQPNQATDARTRGDTMIVFVTATVIDPAGNRMHKPEEVAKQAGQSASVQGIFPKE